MLDQGSYLLPDLEVRTLIGHRISHGRYQSAAESVPVGVYLINGE